MKFEPVPSEPESTLWEGQLAPRPDLDEDGSKDLLHRQLSVEDVQGDLPAVSIGNPEVLRSSTGITPSGFEQVGAHDFYLIRLWCSFRNVEADVRFERARFKVALSSPDGTDGAPIARDMYPSEVLHKVEHDVKVSLSPELTFTDVSGTLGGLDVGYSYTELQPSIFAAGQGEATPSWMFARTRGYEVRGGKTMHLVVAAPSGMAHCDAELDLIAYVRKRNLVPLPMGLFEKRGDIGAEPLRVRLW